MKKWILLSAGLLGACMLHAQQVTTIIADSVKVSELILENATRNVQGFLFNTSQGRTLFKQGLLPIGDTAYIIGNDTLPWNKRGWASLLRRDTITGVKTFKPVIVAGTDTVVGFSFNPSFTATSNNDTFATAEFKRATLSGQLAGSRTNSTWFRDKVILEGDVSFYRNFAYVKDSQFYSNSWIRGNDNPMYWEKPSAASPEQLIIQPTKGVKGGTALRAGTLFKDSVIFTEGVQDYAFIKAMPVLRQQDGASGALRGFYITPKLTGVTDFRAVQVDMDNGTGSVLYASGTAPSAFGGLIQYFGNYNSQLSEQSLVEKRYVDSVSGGGQWTVTGNTAVSQKHVAVGTMPHENEYFAVAGTALIKKVKVSTTGVLWPDYVFDAGYKLTSLSSLKAYVRKYRHLPGVPSAANLEKEGADVVTMQAALLKQVEELTLRVINQHDVLKKQEEKLSALEKKSR